MMSFPPITAAFAALLGLWLIWLSVAVVRQRIRAGIALGAGEDRLLLRASRAQANFTEYVPMGLILLLLLELGGLHPLLLGLLGASLLGGRVVHALAISREPETLGLRRIGMLLTFGMIALSALALFWLLLARS